MDDPYNMYFTPDGRYAIVVAETRQHLDFRNPHTFALEHRIPVNCAGVDHIDFAASGAYLIATCEFSGRLVRVDLHTLKVAGYLNLPGSAPQDIKLDPAGRTFYVADKTHAGVWLVDAVTFRPTGFIPTGPDAHGLYPSRDAQYLYVTNRGNGSITVISFATKKIITTWRIPGGGSPDMGGLSPDGKVFWLSGRYDSVVYAVSAVTGRLLAKIPVGVQPHGLCVWPQPGRYSLGQAPGQPAKTRSYFAARRSYGSSRFSASSAGLKVPHGELAVIAVIRARITSGSLSGLGFTRTLRRHGGSPWIPATQGSIALQGDTRRGREETARIASGPFSQDVAGGFEPPKA